MNNSSYTARANKLILVIDIAIESFKNHPPAGWDEANIEHVINCYSSWKYNISNPAERYKNLASLKYKEDDIFTMFQESSGACVNYFWEKIAAEKLPFKRENKLKKILNAKKITNIINYDLVIDVMVPYKQEGLINDEEYELLQKLLSAYELKAQKKLNPKI